MPVIVEKSASISIVAPSPRECGWDPVASYLIFLSA